MVQPDESSSRTLDSLPPRPPTPPRDSQQHLNANSRPSLFNRIFSKSLGAQTPPDLSPGSAAGAASSPSERTNRRVAWSASTDYRDHEEPSKNPNALNPKLRLIPSSADRQLPPKSILKQNNGDAVNRHIDFHIQPHEHTPETFATMLESVTKQLAGDDRLSRIDAYMSLSGVLKATDDIPDEEALRNKMGLLAQFIRRDMTATQPDGEVDKVLVNNSLTLLASLLYKNEQFSQEFAIFVLEHTITSFEQGTIPKDVAKHLLFIDGQQNFSPKIVTTDRATRLLNATYMIREEFKGKSIALGQLGIYKKLLHQARPVMLANTNWLRHVFEDMLNHDKNVRVPFIAFGLEAASILGTEKLGTRAFTQLFESQYDENTKYADYYHARLARMLQAKGDNATLEKASVPRIWSVLILFLRHKPAQIDKWTFWTPYLLTLQKCFNNSDQEVKAQANLAWNRLVFALQPDETAEKRRLNRQLLQPFLGQLHAKRRPTGKGSKEAFQITVSSACNLLYYAFRPGASAASLDLLWDLYVPPLIQQLSETDSNGEEQKAAAASCEGTNQAIAILHALLNPTPRAKQPWKAERAMGDERMRFDELSPIDSKWVRANSSKVLGVLQPLIGRRFKDLSADDSRLKDLWKSFLLSVAAAGSKEIITSHETMQCIAQIYTMVHTFWQKGPCQEVITREGQSTAFLDGFVYLITETVKVLGMLPFWEKRLSIDDLNPFAVVATPSTSSKRAPKAAKSPVQCLIALLTAPGVDMGANFALKGALRRLLLPFYEFRLQNKTSLDLCQELFQTLPPTDGQFNRGALQATWCVLADFLQSSLADDDEGTHYGSNSNNSSNGGQLLGVSFRDKVRVLEYGLVVLRHNSLPDWQNLYYQVSLVVYGVVGPGGHALSVVEPLSRTLCEKFQLSEARSFISLYSTIVEDAHYPETELSLDAARRKLWGASTATHRPSRDPFKHLYSAINFFLDKAYYLEGSSVEVAHMLMKTGALVRRCPHNHHEGLLQTLSDGLSLWLRDVDDVINSADSHSSLKDAMHSLWMDIRSAVDTRAHYNDLNKLKTILAAALSSRQKYIVSSAIEMWNELFGVRENLQYPDEVAKALARLRSSANLLLPNFPDISDDEVPPATISFLESDDSEPIEYASTGGPRGRSLTPSVLGSSPYKARGSPAITLGLPRSSASHQLLDVPVTGSARKRKPVKLDTTPRLRHDNSQIKFAAIEATPEPADAESQLLTDHQREIKERQLEENATMFANLRSSPRPKAKKAEKKRLSLTSDRPVSQAEEEEQPATPSVTGALRTLDDWITSSPTPQNRKQKHIPAEEDLPEEREEVVKIASSPPKAAASFSPSPAAESRTPSTHANFPTDPSAEVEMSGTATKPMEVPTLHPPAPSDVDSPPSFANLVDHLASESVTKSSPAVPIASMRFKTFARGPRRKSPIKVSEQASPEEDDGDEDEIMEEAPPIPLPTQIEVQVLQAPELQKDTEPPPEKLRKRGRPKSSKNTRKSQEQTAEAVAPSSQQLPAISGQEERRRSSSLSELDESMVKSLEAHHSVESDGRVNYIALKPNENFSPEQYAKVDVFSSPLKSPEPETAKKETRIVPPSRSASKGKSNARNGTATATPEPTAVKTTRAAEKRKSMTPTVETPIPTPQRASSRLRLRHVDPPEVIDLEKVDPSPARSGVKLSRSQRRSAFAESVKKTPVAKGRDIEVVKETPAALETPKPKSHKKKVAEQEVLATPSVLETSMRIETPVPVPSRKRKSSHQVEREVEQVEATETAPTVETVSKSSKNKRRKKDEKRLQPQVVEDSQQDQRLEVEHEGITVPPLSQGREKPEPSGSSSTFRTAKSASASQASSRENADVATTKRKSKHSRKGENGRWVSAAERSVVESSQLDEREIPPRRREKHADITMADAPSEAQSQPGDAEDDAISIVSSHLEVEETVDATTVRYIDRHGILQRQVSKSKSPSIAHSRSPEQAAASADSARPNTDVAEAQVEAQLRSSAVSSVAAGTPPRRASMLMEGFGLFQQQQQALELEEAEGGASAMWLHSHSPGQEDVPSTPSSAGAGERIVIDSSELGYASSSLPSNEMADLGPSEVSSSQPSSELLLHQHYTSSPPPQLTEEEQRRLDEVRESQRHRSRAPSAPPSEIEREELARKQLVDEVEEERDSSGVDEDVNAEASLPQPRTPEQAGQRILDSEEEYDEEMAALNLQIEAATANLVEKRKIVEERRLAAAAAAAASVAAAPIAGAEAEEGEELTYESIAAVFRHGVEMLNRCQRGIRRHHVARMEELVFDIKGAVYNAERRSREALSEEERAREFGRL